MIFRRLVATAVLLLGTLASAQVSDSVPYDSIANPLSKLPATDTSVQRKGDLLNLKPSRVRVNQAGYRPVDIKAGLGKFYYVGTGLVYKVIDDKGQDVPNASGAMISKGAKVSGQVNPKASKSAEHANGGDGDWKSGYPMTGTVVSGDLMQGILPTDLGVGRYRIVVGTDTSARFIVSDNVYGMARDAALKFFGVARSGEYESWFHPASHLWDGWLYDSAARNTNGTYKYKGALTGGWYDCGNHLKEAVTNAYPLSALGMMAATNASKDVDHYALNQAYTVKRDGVPDVLREAWVGAQFVLKSFRLAKGIPDSMYLSVGDPTTQEDFGYWGQPHTQDNIVSTKTPRGGRKERRLLRNWGSESMSNFAAGMAYLGRLYQPYDKAFADTALLIAERMYETAKKVNRKEGTTDYGSGGSNVHAAFAHAAIALLWATHDSKYLKDAAYTPNMPDGQGKLCADPQTSSSPATRFKGGFMGCGPNSMAKIWATNYMNVHSFALYSFIKLILVDPDTAKRYGIATKAQRDTLLELSINNLIPSNMSGGGKSIDVPVGNPWSPARISYDSLWYSMSVDGSGWWNKYQFGNLADLYMYYDATGAIEGTAFGAKAGNTDWKRKEVLEVLVGGLGYMFGMNPLDLSFVYGIGTKNPMHPHHRGANPEGRNTPGNYYNYRIPVGGLYGAMRPENTMTMTEFFDKPVSQTEANCPDASAVQVIPLMGLARIEEGVAPTPTVKVLYTTNEKAVVQVDLDRWGFASLKYGTDSSETSLTQGPVFSADTSNSVKITVPNLQAGTKYWFMITTSDREGRTRSQRAWFNAGGDSIKYSFTTKLVPQEKPIFSNIRVCNVTSDSADVIWYTANGEYLSSVQFADSLNWKAKSYRVIDTDLAGDVPVKFHHVRLYGLSPKTTYYFKVGIPGAWNDPEGCFRTPNEDVKFEVRAAGYKWSGMRALTIGVTNQDAKTYDSLQLRLYVTGTAANVWDLGARCDIGIKYRTDGYQDDGFAGIVDKDLRKSHPVKIDSSCADAAKCEWYFDVPLYATTMEPMARFRLDLVFDQHKIEMSQPPNPKPVLWDDLMNLPPTHDVFDVANGDWSFRKHVRGTDNGLSPVDYPGIPYADNADAAAKEIMDNDPTSVPVNPYIAVYRRNEFVYGFSPFAGEQATKRTVMDMVVTPEAPFDQINGSTITISEGMSSRLKAKIDAYDRLIPDSKGYITSIWVNGTKISDAERRSALTKNADGTWKLDLPLRLSSGTSKLDVTIFSSVDTTEDVAVAGCSEGKGCAFTNLSWYVNFLSTKSYSIVDLLDENGNAMSGDSTIALDDAKLILQVNDPDRDKTGSADVIHAVVNIASKGKTWSRVIALTETGANTGIFRSDKLQPTYSSDLADLAKLPMNGVDTVTFTYVDSNMVGDTGRVRAFSKVTFPIDSAWIVDSNGDGLADQIGVAFKRILDPNKGEVPDSFVVAFGKNGDKRTLIKPANGSWTSDYKTYVGALRTPFPATATTGTELKGSGKLFVSRGGNLDTSSFQDLLDRVGPNLVTARLRYGSSKDTLLILATEAVKATDAANLVHLVRGDLAMEGTASNDTIRIVVDTGAVLPMVDSVRAALGLSDAIGNDAVAKSPAVLVIGGDRPPRQAWYSDANGDGIVDSVTLVFTPRWLHKVPSFVFSWPGTSGKLVQIKLVASEGDTGKGRDTIGFKLVGFDSLVTGLSGTGFTAADLGQMVDPTYGDTSRFAIEDRVAPVLSSAKLKYSGDEGGLDTLELHFSEPVTVLSGNVVVLNVDGNLVKYVNYAVDPTDARVVRLFVDSTAKFSRGDSLSISTLVPAALTDLEGNAATVNGRWARLTYGARPPVYIVEVRNPLQKLDEAQRAELAKQDPAKAVQLLVRAPGGEWKALGQDGKLEAVEQGTVEQGTGVMLTVNEGVDGYAYIYDNLGTYLVGMDLSRHKVAWDKGTVPTSASMRTQLWIRWDGRDKKGAIAAYGVYSMRLVSRRQFEGQGSETSLLLNKVYKMGWGKKK